MFDSSEESRAVALIASMIDGYQGGEVDDALIYLLTDVDDWEALVVSLAGRAATAIVLVAKMNGLDPYEVWETCIS